MKIGPFHIVLACTVPNEVSIASHITRQEGHKVNLNVADVSEVLDLVGKYFAERPPGVVLAWRDKQFKQ